MKRKINIGFSLIEMLAVICIIGLVAAMSAPLISRFMKGNNMLMAVQNIEKTLSSTRQLAITANAFYTVEINSVLGLLGVYDTAADGTVDTTDRADKFLKLPRDVKISLPSAAADNRISAWKTTTNGRIRLTYNSKGQLHTGSADISRIYVTVLNYSTAATDQTYTIRVYRMSGTTKELNYRE